jgi:hypothetical protein
MTRKRPLYNNDLDDEFDARDPQISNKRFVPLDEAVDQVDPRTEIETLLGLGDDYEAIVPEEYQLPHADRLLGVLRHIWDPNSPLFATLTRQQREVITQRLLLSNDQATYRAIARTTKPPLSGPEQVRRVEQRATQKLARHFSNISKDLEEKT